MADLEAPNPRLWRSIWKLLEIRLRIALTGFRRARWLTKLAIGFGFLLFLAILGFGFYLSWLLLRFLGQSELSPELGDILTLIPLLPRFILAGAFLGILATSFGVLLQALYLAGDMDFLLSRPVPIRAVFIAKLLQAVLPNFALVSLFSLPLMFGLGAAQNYNILYYPLVVIHLIFFALAAAGVSSLLVMVVVRVFPARRVAEILGFLGATLSFVCSQSGTIANWNGFPADRAQEVLQALQQFDTPWSPIFWAGKGLVDIGSGNWLNGSLLGILSIGLAGGVFTISLVISERLYYSGWANLQGRVQKKKGERKTKAVKHQRFISLIERLISPAIRAIAIKDWIVLRRDIRNMSQLVTPLIIGVVYSVMLLRSGGELPAGRGEAPAWFMDLLENGSLYVYANVGISLFVGWALLGRLAGMAFSQEGKNYWVLKSSPVSTRDLIAAKFVVAYLPVVFLSWLFSLIIWVIQRESFGILVFSFTVVGISIAGNAGINLAFGITGANMSWENPRQMQRGSASCLGALATAVYLPLDLLLFFGPPVFAKLIGLPEFLGIASGLLFGGIFSAACGIVPLWLVRKQIPKLDEA